MNQGPALRAAILSLVLLAGCAAPADQHNPTPAPSSAADTSTRANDPAPIGDEDTTPQPVTIPDLDQFTPAPTGQIDEHSGETVTAEPVPTWDTAAQAEALTAATKAMKTFARPHLDYTSWWADFAPLVTPSASESFSYIDPANISPTKVTDDPSVKVATSAYVVTIEVPTDTGPWHIVLTRRMGGAPWLVASMTPLDKAS